MILEHLRANRVYQDVALFKYWKRASPVELRRLRELTVSPPSGPGSDRIRLRMLGAEPVHLRRGTSDAIVAWDVVVGFYHTAPREVPRTARLILDLGANIGLTMAHYASQFPTAEIRGVELDRDNAAVARRNTASFGARCVVVTAAAWWEDGEVEYALTPGHEFGTAVSSATQSGIRRKAKAVSISSLLKRGEHVDFMKVDIEGAEAEIFRRGHEWAHLVRALKVEVHPPYSVTECRLDLEALGFRVRRDTRHVACLVAFR